MSDLPIANRAALIATFYYQRDLMDPLKPSDVVTRLVKAWTLPLDLRKEGQRCIMRIILELEYVVLQKKKSYKTGKALSKMASSDPFSEGVASRHAYIYIYIYGNALTKRTPFCLKISKNAQKIALLVRKCRQIFDPQICTRLFFSNALSFFPVFVDEVHI